MAWTKTAVNSDEFTHSHIPIPNANIAKTNGNYSVSAPRFLAKNANLVFFSPFSVRWIPPAFFYSNLSKSRFGFPYLLAGSAADVAHPMAKAKGTGSR